MQNIIINKLNDIEKEHNIKILYAIESGSRGWGVASKDSDYDVRFIYSWWTKSIRVGGNTPA